MRFWKKRQKNGSGRNMSKSLRKCLEKVTLAPQVATSEQDLHYRQAAVLILFYRKQNEWYLLFTKRSQQVNHHKGQISFPGGAKEEGDATLLHTALRETKEEIGLLPENIQIVGRISPHRTVTSNYQVWPFIGIYTKALDITHLTIEEKEVEKILEVPLRSLLQQYPPQTETIWWKGEKKIIYYYKYDHDVIWGATATILTELLKKIVEKRKERDCSPLFV